MRLEDSAALAAAWRAEWPRAIGIWSRFTKLREPQWCFTTAEERAEQLTGSFAMIRLTDQTIVISLRQILELGLEEYPCEVMAHEIGHHVYCPADLTDEARLIAYLRAALPTREDRAPLVSNLYTDILINDRLTRVAGLRMGDIYQKLAAASSSRLWTFYMRTCEVLWSLQRGTLARGPIEEPMENDARLGARLIRAYSQDWLRGAGRFAALCFDYLDKDAKDVEDKLRKWLDTHGRSESGVPDGLAEIDPDEIAGAIHPSLDEAISGVPSRGLDESGTASESTGDGEAKKRYRDPLQYADVLRSVGVKLSPDEIISRYYRERAMPHLIKFPAREKPLAAEPMMEGLESWDISDSLEELDIVETLLSSEQLIPGMTTRKRIYGTSEGDRPTREPLDLYVGIDCSGSMGNPRTQISWPILAGTIVALSALRAGSRVKVVLSGEPGKYVSTPDFGRDEKEILTTLTSYLGTGYSFGIHRLEETFETRKPKDRPVHILIVTDHDIYAMLRETRQGLDGWEVAKRAFDKARGGGTYVLNMPLTYEPAGVARMEKDGWTVARIQQWEDIVEFARRFSRSTFGGEEGRAVKTA